MVEYNCSLLVVFKNKVQERSKFEVLAISELINLRHRKD